MRERRAPGPDYRLLIGFWALLAAAFAARAFYNAPEIPWVADSDDAMRLVVVRDFLNGQGWYDHIQHRLNTPFGAEIHWSRMVDLPLAGLMLLLMPFAGAQTELWVAFVWPLILLFVLLLLTAKLSVRLAGREAMLPGLVLPVLSAAVMVEFGPGRVDHHSIQIILTLLMVLATLEARSRPRWAIVAGIAAATSLAVGVETVPLIAAAIAGYGLFWVFEPRSANGARSFGLAFAGAALAHLMIAKPPADWLVFGCDAFSASFALAALGTGLVLFVLTALPLQRANWLARLAAGATAGALLVAFVVWSTPMCLAGPYGNLDPYLQDNWIARISEAKPIWESMASLPAYTAGIAIPPLLAVIVVAFRLVRGEERGRAEWLILGLFLLFAVAAMLLQVRGARLTAAIAVPAGAWLITQARIRYLSSRSLTAAAGLIGSWLGFAGIAIAVSVTFLMPDPEAKALTAAREGGPLETRLSCFEPGAFDGLASIPPERIMAPVDLGSHLLWQTPHEVVGAPYHRNAEGVLDTFRFFNAPLDEAREILRIRGISLIVTCPSLPEMAGFPDMSDLSFLALDARGELPGWIDEVTPQGARLRTFAVLN
jgi:hypothetical protein